MITSIIIGNRIADARKRKNISQAQLAQQLSISPQAVGKWERGESMPDLITLNRLAEILSVDLNYFSGGFKSTATETKPVEPLEIQPGDSSTGKQNKKLNWDMSRGNWVDADFSGLKNLHEKFSASNMLRCKFIGSDLAGLLLKGNNVDSCDFSGSDFSNSQIQASFMTKNLFKNCSLRDTRFSESYINACDFTGADLSGVEFKSGGITGVVTKSIDPNYNPLADAVWKHTIFKSMYLAEMVFEGTMDDCYFENCSFKKVTFRNATITNTFFKNKSLKRIRFIDCQADRMTYEFLKNGKADLTGITLITS
jgi:uncharacterized protein YjbI with pentapeptide repeats